MKFLIDTNVLIPLEPIAGADVDAWTQAAAAFSRAALAAGHQIFVHPAARSDLDRDPNQDRSALRRMQFDKYPLLPDPPGGDRTTRETLGEPAYGTNDWVDDQLIIALYCNAVDCVVSEDAGLHKKARKLGLDERALRLSEAAEAINGLSGIAPEPPPLVHSCKVHLLDRADPIFESFRSDYGDFDAWLAKAARDHRDAWLIKRPDGHYAGLTIVKISIARPQERNLKICSFKIADDDKGQKYGELLLKAVFEHCYSNGYQNAYLTVLPKHSQLVGLLERFGFARGLEPTRRGEDIFVKTMFPKDFTSADDPIQYHIAYGPRFTARSGVASYVVPIQPRYHQMLFPELDRQLAMFSRVGPCGNAILKAYLCHSPTRRLVAGANLFFYRSGDQKSIRCTGVVERTLVSSDESAIVRAVAKRTVYTLNEIRSMVTKPVLVILFRHSRSLTQGIDLDTLLSEAIVKRAPQSIQQLETAAAQTLWRYVDAADDASGTTKIL